MSRFSKIAAKAGVALVLFLAVASHAQAPGAPVLSSPTNGAIGVAVTTTVTWGKVTGATAYHLQLTVFSSFTGTVFVNQDGITGTSLGVTGMTAGTAYYWRVDAESTTGTSAWSSIWSFVTIPAFPAAPILISPSNGYNYRNPCDGCPFPPLPLVWTSVTGATTYTVQVSMVSTFATTVFNQSGSTTSAAYTYNARQLVLYWRANASNASGIRSNWSAVWYFNIEIAIAVLPTNVIENQSSAINFVHGKLSYNLKTPSQVDFSLFDIFGKKLFEFNHIQFPGSYSFSLKNRNLPAGIYFLHFKAGLVEKRMKVVLTGG